MRKIFFSFDYENDFWRASQIRNMGVVEENPIVSDDEWEELKKQGENTVKKWIDDNLKNHSCTVVLIGEETEDRKWINYEIKQSWESDKGVVGIYIHNLKNYLEEKSEQGENPFYNFIIGKGKKQKFLAEKIKCYDPPYQDSKDVLNWIKENLEDIVEEAISIGNNYKKK